MAYWHEKSLFKYLRMDFHLRLRAAFRDVRGVMTGHPYIGGWHSRGACAWQFVAAIQISKQMSMSGLDL